MRCPDRFPRVWLDVLLVVGLFQVAQGAFVAREVSSYGRSYWLVDYSAGFVRRGLLGEAIRRLTGRLPSALTIEVLSWVGFVLVIGAVIAVVVRLLRSGTELGWSAATVIVFSPFVIDQIGNGRGRIDQTGLLVLLVVGVVLATTRWNLWPVSLVGGLALAVTVLAAENTVLEVAPWLALLVLVRARREQRAFGAGVAAALVVVGPALAAATAVAAAGTPGRAQVDALHQAARASDALGPRAEFFGFLGDSVKASVGRVISTPPERLAGSVLAGGIVVALLVFVFRDYWRWLVREVAAAFDDRRGWIVVWVVIVLGMDAVLFATAFDWMRWIGQTVTIVVITAGLVALAVTDGTRDAPASPAPGVDAPDPDALDAVRRQVRVLPARSDWKRWGAMGYLVVLAPAPTYLTIDGAIAFLLALRR